MPTAEPGVSKAHPNGLNTNTGQNKDGGVAPPLASWGVGANTFFTPGGDGAGDERAVGSRGYDGLPGASNYSGFGVWDVTDIVTGWAAGTPNYGAYMPSQGNWAWQFSETTLGDTPVHFQPALFIEYTPKPPPIPEPAGLGLMGLAMLALKRRR